MPSWVQPVQPLVLLPKNVALGFMRFCCNNLISGYHDTLLLTNLAVLLWQGAVPYALYYSDPDSSCRALWFFLAALGNFYAAATVRFNDSGFTSGLCLFLPPFLMFNQILIYTLGYPTMVLAGATCGRSLVLHFGWADPRCVLCLLAAVGMGWFFRDVCCWVPHLGHLGGAGSSEGLDASYQRAGRYPACFAAAMVLAALTAAAFSSWMIHSGVICLTLAVMACQMGLTIFSF